MSPSPMDQTRGSQTFQTMFPFWHFNVDGGGGGVAWCGRTSSLLENSISEFSQLDVEVVSSSRVLAYIQVT